MHCIKWISISRHWPFTLCCYQARLLYTALVYLFISFPASPVFSLSRSLVFLFSGFPPPSVSVPLLITLPLFFPIPPASQTHVSNSPTVPPSRIYHYPSTIDFRLTEPHNTSAHNAIPPTDSICSQFQEQELILFSLPGRIVTME